ncbi:unnamed protein product, partial [Polarella glacialis]
MAEGSLTVTIPYGTIKVSLALAVLVAVAVFLDIDVNVSIGLRGSSGEEVVLKQRPATSLPGAPEPPPALANSDSQVNLPSSPSTGSPSSTGK